MDAKSPSVKFVLLCLWCEGRQSQVLVSSQLHIASHTRSLTCRHRNVLPSPPGLTPRTSPQQLHSAALFLAAHRFYFLLKSSLSVQRYKSALQLTVTVCCGFLTSFESQKATQSELCMRFVPSPILIQLIFMKTKKYIIKLSPVGTRFCLSAESLEACTTGPSIACLL